ncbi:MAG: cytochrome c maturation protein CcmE [Alphaproteobacteria bacterium]|nr:cytochrome c maturation protein CcmE [Alphaproteobacteria bacterium]
MRKRSQRLWLIGAAGLLGVAAIALAASGLKDTVAYFYAPSELVEKNEIKPGQSVRIGGLVEKKSIRHGADGSVLFRVTDGTNAVPVTFSGLLPDLFKEDQGVVAEGKFNADGELVAKRVLARHDETYMPKEVYEAFRKKAEMEAAAAKKAPGT